MTKSPSSVDTPLRIISLCSGAGMLDLGVKAACPESRVICFCERESAAASILLERMEDQALEPAPIFAGDLADIDWAAFTGIANCVVAGFPCQPWSVAGKQRGVEDERWIWQDIAECIRVVRPQYVFLENVTGLLTSGLGHVLGSLAEMGFDAAWGSLKASSVGASHRRERVFILAHATESGLKARGSNGIRAQQGSIGRSVTRISGEALADTSSLSGERRGERGELGGSPQEAQAEGHQREWCGQAVDGGVSVVANSGGTGWEGSELTGALRDRKGSGAYGSATEFRGPLFAPGPNDPRWGDILEFDPSLKPAICRDSDGMAGRMDRLRICGNGVVPLQAAVAFTELSRRLDERM